MTPEAIVAEVYKRCAQQGRIDLIPVVVRRIAERLRELADECDALLKIELEKKKKERKKA